MSRGREIALGAAAAILFAAAIATALGWSAATAMFPVVIGVAGLGLAIWAVAADVLRSRKDAPEEAATIAPEDRARARASFAWIGVFFAAVLAIGFQWGLPLAALAFYRLEARLGWIAAVAVAAICGGFIYFAGHFLHIPHFPGLLERLIP